MSQYLTHLQTVFNWTHNALSIPKNKPYPGIVIAHRGLYGHPSIKENTLEAFDFAIRNGAGIEYDLHLSSDEVPLINHDTTLDRIFGIPHSVRETPFYKTQTLCPEVPSLEQLLLKHHANCPYHMVEIKGSDDLDRLTILIKKTIDLFEQLGTLDKVTFLSLDLDVLRLIRNIRPELPRAFVYLVSPKLGLAYLEEDPDCKLAGWFFTYPKKIQPSRILGVGFLNHKKSFSRESTKQWPFIFTDRLDKIT